MIPKIKTSDKIPKDTIFLVEPRWYCCPWCGNTGYGNICEKCHWPGGMVRAIITNLEVPEGY